MRLRASPTQYLLAHHVEFMSISLLLLLGGELAVFVLISGINELFLVIMPMSGLLWLVGVQWFVSRLQRRLQRRYANQPVLFCMKCGYALFVPGDDVMRVREDDRRAEKEPDDSAVEQRELSDETELRCPECGHCASIATLRKHCRNMLNDESPE